MLQQALGKFTLFMLLTFSSISFSTAQQLMSIDGRINDSDTGKPIPATLNYQTLPYGNQVGIVRVNKNNGEFTFKAIEDGEYELTATAEGYEKSRQIITLKGIGANEHLFIEFKLKKQGEKDVLRLNNLTFDQNKAEIKDSSFSELDELAQMVRNNPTMIIQLEGHTDFRGSAKGNMRLSEERVKAVKDYLVKHDVQSNHIKIKAFGGTKPITRQASEEARAQNRRVEVRILKF
ncbi:OmpA family protein [Persicobacter psychrovividus]|uniref:OmpA-like domain-containing protein n=1 Tax=Persicobacter psychrovividus TaxID=387638 RepID=A0ABN6LB63_9BACT|nr:hypothetical protein PEPS_27110 [Persicobacter psychrovividus]